MENLLSPSDSVCAYICSGYKSVEIQVWQSHVEIEGYSILYFYCIAAFHAKGRGWTCTLSETTLLVHLNKIVHAASCLIFYCLLYHLPGIVLLTLLLKYATILSDMLHT